MVSGEENTILTPSHTIAEEIALPAGQKSRARHQEALRHERLAGLRSQGHVVHGVGGAADRQRSGQLQHGQRGGEWGRR